MSSSCLSSLFAFSSPAPIHLSFSPTLLIPVESTPGMPTIYQLGHEPIKDHVFFPDHKTLVVTKDNTVELYKVENANSTPQLVGVLRGHDKTVTSVDISPDGKRILTCSQDRNALVWEKKSGEYKPTLVLLRISRAATVCKWSPSGNKFAVGSSDRVVAVCYYEEENDWWVSKHLKKPLKSTITTIAWHPNDVLLACGSTDGHVRVFSAYIKGLDAKPEPTLWGSKLPERGSTVLPSVHLATCWRTWATTLRWALCTRQEKDSLLNQLLLCTATACHSRHFCSSARTKS